MTQIGTLYGIGVGPGDPELLTLKAARIIEATPVITVPVAQEDGESHALNVVESMLKPDQRVLKLHFPMVRDIAEREAKRQAATQTIVEELQVGRDVAFLTEGDPMFHSTFGYVLNLLPEGLSVEVIPGVSSIMAAAADIKTPLVNAGQRLAVIPAVFENVDELHHIFAEFDTVVLMKVYRVLDRVLDLLDELGLIDQAVIVERASHAEGRVIKDVQSVQDDDVHYMSLMIVHTK